MTVLLCLFVWMVCLWLACWVDLDAQKHIAKGLDDAWKQVQKGEA